jgi:hypothetical protein
MGEDSSSKVEMGTSLKRKDGDVPYFPFQSMIATKINRVELGDVHKITH